MMIGVNRAMSSITSQVYVNFLLMHPAFSKEAFPFISVDHRERHKLLSSSGLELGFVGLCILPWLSLGTAP